MSHEQITLYGQDFQRVNLNKFAFLIFFGIISFPKHCPQSIRVFGYTKVINFVA